MVPPPAQKSVLEELHETHLGASKMKALAQSYIWWPKMDDSIEDVAKRFPSCQQASSSPPKHHFIHGNGLHNHGVGYIWILLDHLQYGTDVFSCGGFLLKVAGCPNHAVDHSRENH